MSTLRWKAAVWKLVRIYIEAKNQEGETVDPDVKKEHDDKVKTSRNLCVFKVCVKNLYFVYNLLKIVCFLSISCQHSFIFRSSDDVITILSVCLSSVATVDRKDIFALVLSMI